MPRAPSSSLRPAPNVSSLTWTVRTLHSLQPCLLLVGSARLGACPSPVSVVTRHLIPAQTRCVLGSAAIFRDDLLHRWAPVLIKTACSR